jgi:hypothetical protein
MIYGDIERIRSLHAVRNDTGEELMVKSIEASMSATMALHPAMPE